MKTSSLSSSSRSIPRCFSLPWLWILIQFTISLCCAAATHPNTAVVIWGSYGTYTIPDLTNAVAIAAGGTAGLALTEDGEVSAFPLGPPDSLIIDYLPPGLSNIVMISAGDDHGFALGANGAVTSWGAIEDTNTPAGLTNFLSVDCGWGSNLGLLADGNVAVWGYHYIDTNYPPDLTNVVDISAGHRHFAALRGDGTVISWGYTNLGSTLVPPGLSNVTAISCGAYHTLALQRDGGVVAWGSPASITNTPLEASNVVAIAAGYHQNLALRSDGRVVTWGSAPVSVSEFSNVMAIAGGNSFIVALISSDPPWPVPELTRPRLQSGSFQTEIRAFRGRRYFLEQTTDLSTNVWDTSPGVAGSDQTHQFSAPSGTTGQKFLRLRSQQ